MGRAGARRPRAVVVPLLLLAALDSTGLLGAATAEPLRRLRAPTPPPGTGGYSFLVPSATGGPVAFDPCRPVRWVVRTDGEPAGGRAVVEAAVAEVARATGLQFVFAGTTDEAPAPDRPRRQPERYGDRWAPVLVAWTTAWESPELAGETVGSGVTSWAGGRPAHLVTGQLLLDVDDLTDDAGRPTPLAAPTALHELAHVVGLGHVDDADQLLNPVMTGRTAFGDGDLRGLSVLGSGPCG